MNAITEITPAVYDAVKSLDELVRTTAREIHAEHTDPKHEGYIKYTLRGSYDDDESLIALRAAIRCGMEISNVLAASAPTGLRKVASHGAGEGL